MKTTDIIEVTFKVVNVFEKLGIPYYLGGSLASSAFGIPRSTLDADIVADIKSEQVAYMEELLKREFYIDTEMINHAILHKSSFNLIHLEISTNGQKGLVFLTYLKRRLMRQECLRPGTRI